MLLVGQLDGVLKGIDAVTGEMIWQFDSGSPLVSSHTPDALSRGHVSSPTFFPGADGGLYHYNGDEGKLEVCCRVLALLARHTLLCSMCVRVCSLQE